MKNNKTTIFILLGLLLALVVFGLFYAVKGSKIQSPVVNEPVAQVPTTPDTIPDTTPNTTPDTAPVTTLSLFNTNYTLSVHDTITFSDGLSITLREINDARCKSSPTMMCVWAGEIAPILNVTGGAFGTSTEEVRLGAVMVKTKIVKGYTFTLSSATETSAVISVTK